VYPRSAPERIGGNHVSYQLANFQTHARPAWSFRLRQLPPISFETSALPGNNCFWPDDHKSRSPVIPDCPERYPKQPVPPKQPRTLDVSFEDSQLLAKACIFQCNLFVTTEQEDNEPNRH